MPPTVVTAYGNSDDAQLERDLLKAVDANLVHVANLDSSDASPLLRQADALIVTTHRVSAELIASLERCKVISRAGTGLRLRAGVTARTPRPVAPDLLSYPPERVAS